jgi:hypothetical protein
MFLSAFNFGITVLSSLFSFFLGISLGDGITIGGLFFVVLTMSIVIGWIKKALGMSTESAGKFTRER